MIRIWISTGALLGLIAGMGFIASGRLHRDHRGFSPPPASARFDLPLWLVVLVFVGMGFLGPFVALWQRW